ncbi:MAG: diacylglycerol kinase family protein [Patescibacteria group bacterium]|nr:diacylglycerol kinase family protein [Patescibacteria group bacterium]
MKIIDLKRLIKSFGYSFKGLIYTFKEEQNFRIHLFFAVIVIILMVFFKVSRLESLVLIIAMTLVIFAELVNSIFERIVDILKPRIHSYAMVIKDMMAATVLVAAVAAVAIGVIIFLPRILNLFNI